MSWMVCGEAVLNTAVSLGRYHAETGTPRPDQVHEISIRTEGDTAAPAAIAAGPTASPAAQQQADVATPTAVQPTAVAGPTESAPQASPATLPASPAAMPLPQSPSASHDGMAVQGPPSPSAPAQSRDTATAQRDLGAHTAANVSPPLANEHDVASNQAASPPPETLAPVSDPAGMAPAPQHNGHAASMPATASVPTPATVQRSRPGSAGSGPLKLKRPTNGV
jgi:hypothetical protein